MRKAFIPFAKLFSFLLLLTLAFHSCAKPKEGCKSCTVYQNGSSFTVEGCGDNPESSLAAEYPGADITCH